MSGSRETGPRAAPLPRQQQAAPLGMHSSQSRPIHMHLTSHCPCQPGKAVPGPLVPWSRTVALGLMLLEGDKQAECRVTRTGRKLKQSGQGCRAKGQGQL